jgi:UDP-N-acetylmuramoyl-L-alanyl-D-glutamate--2,6-diaminopimelate ligase
MPDLQEIITTLKPYMTESVCLKTILSLASIKEFKNLSRDSRNCGFDTVFTAVKGVNADGHNFISAVLERGCRLVIYDSALPDNNNIHESVFIKVRNSGEAYAVLAELFCGIPGEKLKLLAVTGTNGKTTTAFILRHIIEFHGYSTGLISTVEYSCAKFHFDAERTTPDALVFQRLLKSFTDNDCTHIVMEVSSHALDQYRIGCTKYDVALFTNLTGDHLDYH